MAACIDFTLAAQADTLSEARRKLHDQIVSYVAEAMTIDSAHAGELLTRRAPALERLRFAFWLAVSRRPRLRHTARTVLDRVGLAIRNRLAYCATLRPVPASIRGL